VRGTAPCAVRHVDNRVEGEAAKARLAALNPERSEAIALTASGRERDGESIAKGVLHMKKVRVRSIAILASVASFLLTAGAGFSVK
jgi:hypothetical protein